MPIVSATDTADGVAERPLGMIRIDSCAAHQRAGGPAQIVDGPSCNPASLVERLFGPRKIRNGLDADGGEDRAGARPLDHWATVPTTNRRYGLQKPYSGF